MRHANVMANQMRMQALLAAGQLARPRLGLVTSYDPNTYAVKATIQPEGFETGWLPICVLMAGNGWGIYAAPANGDQCAISFQEGDREVGFVTGFVPNDQDRPPKVPSGEIWAVHKAGASLKFTSDGKVTLVAPAGFGVQGDTTFTGKVTVTDTFTANAAVNLSGAGGAKVARVGDTVSGGVITSGSNTVKAN